MSAIDSTWRKLGTGLALLALGLLVACLTWQRRAGAPDRDPLNALPWIAR